MAKKLANQAINKITTGVGKVLNSKTVLGFGGKVGKEMMESAGDAVRRSQNARKALKRVQSNLGRRDPTKSVAYQQALKINAERNQKMWSEIGKASFGYFTGADRAGQGLSRVGAVAARGGIAYAGVSAVGRIASGGGLYKDRHGNTDIIGLPFI